MKKRIYFHLLLCVAFTACARHKAEFPTGKIIDLSHPFDAQTIYWPTEEGFKLEKEQDGVTDKGYYYASNKFAAPEHGGTPHRRAQALCRWREDRRSDSFRAVDRKWDPH